MGACGAGTELDGWLFDGTDDEEDDAERLSALRVWRNWGIRRLSMFCSEVVVCGCAPPWPDDRELLMANQGQALANEVGYKSERKQAGVIQALSFNVTDGLLVV